MARPSRSKRKVARALGKPVGAGAHKVQKTGEPTRTGAAGSRARSRADAVARGGVPVVVKVGVAAVAILLAVYLASLAR